MFPDQTGPPIATVLAMRTRTLMSIPVAAVLALGLTACGDDDDAAPATTAVAPAATDGASEATVASAPGGTAGTPGGGVATSVAGGSAADEQAVLADCQAIDAVMANDDVTLPDVGEPISDEVKASSEEISGALEGLDLTTPSVSTLRDQMVSVIRDIGSADTFTQELEDARNAVDFSACQVLAEQNAASGAPATAGAGAAAVTTTG